MCVSVDNRVRQDNVRSLIALGTMISVPRQPELPSERVERELRERLAAGEWASGEALPPVTALAEQFSVSRETVARVLRKLADEGLVTIRPRWGVFRA